MPRDRRRQSRPPLIPELNLTPLIDVALTLLVIFMVTAPMVQNNIKVLLPSGKSKELTQQQEAVLTITAEKNFYFNSYPVKQEDIIAVVKEWVAQAPQSPIFIRADAQVSYGTVLELMDSLKQTGASAVALSLKQA